MARNKRKPTAIVQHTQGLLHAPVTSYSNQSGSLVLGLKASLGTLSGPVSQKPNLDLVPLAIMSSSGARPNISREVEESPTAYGYPSLEGFLVEDCFDEEDLDEEQLDFTFSEDEYEKSPISSLSPAILKPPVSLVDVSLNPPKTNKAGKSHSPPPASDR